MRILFTGEKNSGKSSRMYDFLKGKKCGGIICLPVFKNGRKIGTDAVNMIDGKKKLFSRVKDIADFEGIDTENYRISKDGIDFGIKAIEAAILKSHFIVVDEFGVLERDGRGFYPAIKKLMESDKNAIIIARKGMENYFYKIFPYSFQIIEAKEWWKMEEYMEKL